MVDQKEKVKISKNLAIGIIAVLVLVSVGIYFFSNTGNNTGNISGSVIATVNGEEITSDEVSAVQQSLMQQGQQVSEEDALEQAINQELLSQKVQEEITVTTEEAESVIEQQIAMQNMTLEDYKQQVEMQGVSYDNELANIQEQIATQNYLGTALEGQDFEVTEEEVKEFYEMNKQQIPENVTYEEVEPQITMSLQQQKQQEAISVLIQELRASANVEYLKETDSSLEGQSPQEIPVEIQE